MIAQFTKHASSPAPVVALHSSASSSGQWKQLENEMEGRFPFYAYDLPGYGKSPLKPDHDHDDIAVCAAPVIEQIEEFGAPVHLVGHSNGGAIAVKIALMRPDLVKSLIVYEPTLFHLLQQGEKQNKKLFEEIRQIAGVSTAAFAAGDNAAGMRHFLNYWNGKGFWEQLDHKSQAKFSNLANSIINDFARGFSENWMIDEFEKLSMPSLVMIGMESPLPAQQVAINMVRALPNARLAILPELGHMAPAFQPEWVNPRIFEHINACERAAADCIWPLKAAA